MSGLSSRNLKYMRAFAEAFPGVKLCNRLLHNCLGDMPSNSSSAQRAASNGFGMLGKLPNTAGAETSWPTKFESDLFGRKGKALTNFTRTLPAPQSDLAQELMKDPYSFDFLSLGPEMSERELERGLLEHLRALILELGKGFAFVGSQYHLEVGGQDYYVDLLFYHFPAPMGPSVTVLLP